MQTLRRTLRAWDELAELLSTGSDIEVMCTSCVETWPLSTDERADIARSLERGR